MRTFVFFLLFPAILFAAVNVRNRNALDEDTAIVSTLKSGTSAYSKWMQLSDAEDITVILKMKDTTAAGFASDSFAFVFGYQTGNPVFDSTNLARNEVYSRSPLYVLDTLITDSLGKAEGAYAIEAYDGSITETTGRIDTTNCPVWAVYQRPFYPRWGVFIRFFFVPLTGHNHRVTPIQVKVSRRLYQKVD
jgi:hypothetical protein